MLTLPALPYLYITIDILPPMLSSIDILAIDAQPFVLVVCNEEEVFWRPKNDVTLRLVDPTFL